MAFIKRKINHQKEALKNLESEVTNLKSAVEELTVLNELAIAAGSIMDLDDLLNLIVQKTIKATEAEQGSIILVQQNEKNTHNTLIRREAHTQMMKNYKVGNYAIGWVLNHQQPLIIENLEKDERFKTTAEEEREVHTVLCAPIWLKREIIGVFTLTNKKGGVPFNSSDLRLLSIITAQSAQLINNLILHERIVEKERFEQELVLARKIQRDLVPTEDPNNSYYEIASYFEPSELIGGDYYDYFQLDGNRLGIVIADVSGHGTAAALIMTMMKGIIHSIIHSYSNADRIITELNNIICSIAPEEIFITLQLLIFDFTTHVLQISNAGHHPIIYSDSSREICELIHIKGCALNLSKNSEYPLEEIKFNKDDIFCVYTDGVVESEDMDQNLFGTEKLLEVLKEHKTSSAKETISVISRSVDSFKKGAAQSDDIAIISIKIN